MDADRWARRRQAIDAHFAEHEEQLQLHIGLSVQNSEPAPASAEEGRSQAETLRRRMAHTVDGERVRVLKDVSNTYRSMLEESKRQAAEYKEMAQKQLQVQEAALAELQKATAHICQIAFPPQQ